MFEGSSLDDVTDRAWTAFAVELADRIASVETGTEIPVTPGPSGESTSKAAMIVRKTTRGTVLCESVGTSSPPPPWKQAGDVHTLEDEEAWVDRFVSTIVTHIRTMWNVPHPSFLAQNAGGDIATHSDVQADVRIDVVPHTEAELANSVDSAVRSIPGADVRTSGDGSYCVTIGTIAAYVYVASSEEVRVHVPVVERIAGRTRAAEVVSDLNRRHPRLKFLLVEDRVHTASSIDAHPFVAQHAVNAVLRVIAFAASVDDSFAGNLGGVVAAIHSSEVDSEEHDPVHEQGGDDDVPAPLMTLLEIDAQSGGAVAADDVVAVCGADRAKIACYESFCSEQALSWREFARDAIGRGESETAAEYEAEAVPWDRIVGALQSALRTVGYFDNA